MKNKMKQNNSEKWIGKINGATEKKSLAKLGQEQSLIDERADGQTDEQKPMQTS